MATGDAHWKVGTITVPASTGTVAYTGLGDTPKALIFYGTNWLTEDAAVTSSGTGMFRGMAAPKYDDPSTLLQNSGSVVPPGNAHAAISSAVLMIDTSGTNTRLYTADVTSLDADGFTLDWTTAAAGGYKVIYIALMDVTDVGAFVGVTNTTLTVGWKAGASLLHGAWAGPDISGSDRSQEFFGGGAYPSSGGFTGAGLTAFSFPTSASAQYNIGIYNQIPSVLVAQGGHFTGPFLTTANISAVPTGGSLTDFFFSGDPADGGMVTFWSDESSKTGRVTPSASQGGTAVESSLPFAPGLLVGYSISDEPQGQSTGVRGAIGFSVVTENFQWSALADGSTQGAFQSFQRGVVDTVSGSSVHAGTIALTNNGFVITTEEDDVSANSWVWHAFGHPEPTMMWTPNLYRRQQ